MSNTIQNTYSELLSHLCAEIGDSGNECSIKLPPLFLSVCAKDMKGDKKGHPTDEICDCIIFDPTEERISIVELKSGMPHRRKTKEVRKAKRQLEAGLYMLLDILRDLGRARAKIQLILSCNESLFDNVPAQKNFYKPLELPLKIIPKRVDCGSNLLNEYTVIEIEKCTYQ